MRNILAGEVSSTLYFFALPKFRHAPASYLTFRVVSHFSQYCSIIIYGMLSSFAHPLIRVTRNVPSVSDF